MKVPAAGQRGGFVMGLVVGLLLGLALALGVALYITKAPVPFINKVPQRTAEQDNAEIERNRNWDPNGALGTRPVPRVAAPSASGAVTGTALPPGMVPAVVPPAALAAVHRPRQAQPRRRRGLRQPLPTPSSISCRPVPTRAAKTPSSSARAWRSSARPPASPSASRSAAPSTACAWGRWKRATRPWMCRPN